MTRTASATGETLHLFYQAYSPINRHQHWGHTISADLGGIGVPTAGHLSGHRRQLFQRKSTGGRGSWHRPVPQIARGNMVAASSDPLLLNWEKTPGNPVTPLMKMDENGRTYRVTPPVFGREKRDITRYPVATGRASFSMAAGWYSSHFSHRILPAGPIWGRWGGQYLHLTGHRWRGTLFLADWQQTSSHICQLPAGRPVSN